jgi:hypothetical chaperone protein
MCYHCGLDFGTSNSLISILKENGKGAKEPVQIAAREPSVIFFPKQGICESICFVGGEAIDAYLEYQMQGRFIQSLKSLLSDINFTGTIINKRPYTPTDLVALIIGHLRKKAEEYAGQSITSVVLGRPVYFSPDSEMDRKAELSLKNAARMAGFREINFQYEPIAAALTYESHLVKPEIVMVADLGGGTTDFTIMKLRPRESSNSDRRSDVLATDGVHVGGNGFDSGIMWNKLVTYFGYGSLYESWGKQLEVPIHIFRTLCRWEQIAFLKTSQYRDDLRYFLSGSSDREAIKNLITLIDKNLGYSLFKSIEKAKMDLTEWDAAAVDFDEGGISIHERITEPELSRIILPDLRLVSQTIDGLLEKARLGEEDISTVFLTGGSSLVRRIQKLFEVRFGEEKVRSGMDTFTSVAGGLALYESQFLRSKT